MNKLFETDHIDKQILNILMENSSLSYQEIGKMLFISSGTVHVRVKKLESFGVIKKYTADIDYSKIGYDITCFIGIVLKEADKYNQLVELLEKIPEVISIDYTTGTYSMLVKVICKNTQHLRTVLAERIQTISLIQRIETHISMQQSLFKSLILVD